MKKHKTKMGNNTPHLLDYYNNVCIRVLLLLLTERLVYLYKQRKKNELKINNNNNKKLFVPLYKLSIFHEFVQL